MGASSSKRSEVVVDTAPIKEEDEKQYNPTNEQLYISGAPVEHRNHVDPATAIYLLGENTLHYDKSQQKRGQKGYFVKPALKTLVAPTMCSLCDTAPSSVFCVDCDMHLCDINECNHDVHKPIAMNGHKRTPLDRDITTALQYIRPTGAFAGDGEQIYFILGRKVLLEKQAAEAKAAKAAKKEAKAAAKLAGTDGGAAAAKAEAEKAEQEQLAAAEAAKKKEDVVKMELSDTDEESSQEESGSEEESSEEESGSDEDESGSDEDSDEDESDDEDEDEDEDAESDAEDDAEDDSDDDDDDDGDDGDVKCIMCSTELHDIEVPWQSECEHIACKQCWVDHLEEEEECPKCGELVELEELQPVFVCPVCTEVATLPWTAPCQHTCCNECWRSILPDEPSCPECGDPVELVSVPVVDSDDDDSDEDDSDDD